ncbi:MAG: hypothetical protein AAGA77_11570 [Bacteroidota bacterium]
MKKLLLIFHTLIPVFCFAQDAIKLSDYTIEFEHNGKDDCDKSGNIINPPDTINPLNIPPKKSIEITFNKSSDLATIKCKIEGDDNLHVIPPEKYKDDTRASLLITATGKYDEGEDVVLSYPYELVIMYNGDDAGCTLTIGSDKLEKDTDPKPVKVESKLDLLVGLEYKEYDFGDDPGFCNDIDECNAVLILDCSGFVSGKSKILRKKEDKENCFEKSNSSLKVGEFLKVYIDNINPYIYDIGLNNVFADITSTLPEKEEEPEATEPPAEDVAEENADGDQSATIATILDYGQMVQQLEEFIASVKIDPFPDHSFLRKNKVSIRKKLKDEKLFPIKNIKELYDKLSQENKDQYKASYDIAKTAEDVYYEFSRLSYSIPATLLPIQIKSYDKLILTVTLKDKKTQEQFDLEPYVFRIKGGWNVSQSFGFAINGFEDVQFDLLGVTVPDTVYALNTNGQRLVGTAGLDSIQSIQDKPMTKIVEAPDTTWFPSLGLSTLTHFNYRIGGSFSFGPEIGFVADFYPETNIRYLTGLGFVFNDERHRISLDAGIAFGAYKTFGAGQGIDTLLEGAGAMPTLRDQNATKLYFGISYNVLLNFTNASVQQE